MRLVYHWLNELVRVPADPGTVAREIALRGFEVASVELGSQPVIDFEITANRPDCLNHLGLAREASAIWGVPLQLPDAVVVPRSGIRDAGSGMRDSGAGMDSGSGIGDPGLGIQDQGLGIGDFRSLEVDLEAPDLCPRYCAQVFDVRIGPSPAWLQERLEAAGVRPISNVVDVTNYVMLEIGQPIHAFDLARLAGSRLVIRRARPGERLRTLDGIDRALDPEMLVIADAGRPSAIGGVMGGQDSEISSTTTRIALESAYFQPASVRRTSKRLGLKTEASSRFERGGDIEAPPAGLARAAALFQRIGAGAAAGPPIDRYPAPRAAVRIGLRASRIARLLGEEIPPQDIRRYLEPLGFGVEATPARMERAPGAPAAIDGTEPGWLVTVPSFRVDVVREADLIEEVGRHYGFDRLPVRFPPLATHQPPPDPRIARDRLVRLALTSAGFSESMTFAFIEKSAALPFCEPGVEPPAIANPLSEKFAVLRPSLLAGLVESCAHNRRRGRKDIRLFESGSRFTPAGEGRSAAFVWCGSASEPHWSSPPRALDFFDAKGVVELLCSAFGVIAAEFVASDCAFLVRGRAADVRAGGTTLGVVGQLSPAIAEARGFPAGEEMYVAEIDTEALGALAASDTLRAESLPRFPSIVRDVSILVDDTLPAAAVRGTIRSAAPATLASIVEFDRYQGTGVPDGRVSLSLRLTFRATERTLTDEEAQDATERIVDALRTSHGAERR